MTMDDDNNTSIEWLATSTNEDDAENVFRVGRRVSSNDLIAEWVGAARLVARRDGSQHELIFDERAPSTLREKLKRGGVRLLLRHLHGELGLHGSAVAFGSTSAILIVGGSGSGKSTFAAGLCQRGGRLLADDAVAISFSNSDMTVNVEPTEIDHWLDRSAREALQLNSLGANDDVKIPIRSIGSDDASTRVVAAVVLRWGADDATNIQLNSVGGVTALGGLLPHVVRFALDSPEHQRREIAQLEGLLNAVPTYVLERPKNRFDLLFPAVDMVREVCLKGA
jgi:hypothetical protein